MLFNRFSRLTVWVLLVVLGSPLQAATPQSQSPQSHDNSKKTGELFLTPSRSNSTVPRWDL